MEGTKKPEYRRVVNIVTAAAQKELISLTILAVSVPIFIAIFFTLALSGVNIPGVHPISGETINLASFLIGSGVEVLGGFQAGIIVSGQLLAVYMSNAGGAWDNAKKSIEDEVRDLEKNTGKGSERHKASVVGDTVGDPLKDTAGPALNPMIKVVNLISLILAPLLVQSYDDDGIKLVLAIVGALLFVAFVWAYRKSSSKSAISFDESVE